MLSLLALLVSFVCFAQSAKTLEPTKDGIRKLHEAIARREPQNKRPEDAVVTNIFGRTSMADSGTHQRIVDVVGTISLTTGALSKTVLMDSVAQGEIVEDGIAAYDSDTNQVFYASDGAFGGTVLYANMTGLTLLPPASYYLLPVVFLGYDPVSGSRIIAGVNTPQKSFLVMERPNFGEITYFLFPSEIKATANDAYDGKTQNYYNVYCAALGKCDVIVWNLNSNKITGTYPLSCLPSSGFLTSGMWIDSTNSDVIKGLQANPTLDYGIISFNVKTKACSSVMLSTGLPPKPHIIVAVENGPISGDTYISVTSDVYNAVVTYDSNGKLKHSVKTQWLFEDIFVQEK